MKHHLVALIAASVLVGCGAPESEDEATVGVLDQAVGASGQGLHVSVDSDGFNGLTYQMQRLLGTGGYWKITVWKCPSNVESGCSSYSSSGRQHLNGFGGTWTGNVSPLAGAIHGYFYASGYDDSGARIVHTGLLHL